MTIRRDQGGALTPEASGEERRQQDEAKRSVTVNQEALMALLTTRPDIFIRAEHTATTVRGRVVLSGDKKLAILTAAGTVPIDDFVLTPLSYKLVDPKTQRQGEQSSRNELRPNPLLKLRSGIQPVDLWDEPEGAVPIDAIRRGPPTDRSKNREKDPDELFQAELTKVFKNNPGSWPSTKKFYIIACPDVYAVRRLALQAGLDVETQDTVPFGTVEYTGGSALGYLVDQALVDAGRRDVQTTLFKNDRLRRGIVGLILDDANNRLILLNGEVDREITGI